MPVPYNRKIGQDPSRQDLYELIKQVERLQQIVFSGGGGGGGITSISIASSHGFAGSSSGGNTPILTLSTSITGILNGNGTLVAAAVAGDFPTLNQNTTGSAATLTTPRSIYGNNFDGSVALAQIIASTFGGTGNGFAKLSGPAASEKTFTLPNASATILTDNAVVTVAQGGTGLATLTAHNLIVGNAASNPTFLAPSSSGKIVVSNGTDFVMSTPTFPNASATTRKIIVSDGTNWVASTETYAVPGTSGNILTSDGTNWTSAAPVVTLSNTVTLTNKRVTARVSTTASSATPTPNADTDDVYTVTALAAAATFGAPTGTPTEGQPLTIRIKDNGTARALSFNAIYRASTDFALPTTTVISKTMYLQLIYNNTDTKWDVVGLTQGF